MSQAHSQTPENSRPSLKVIPPKGVAPTNSPEESPASQSLPSPALRWLVIGGLLTGLGVISLMEIPNSVRGDITVASTPNSRSVVYMKIPGTVNKILVEPNQVVQAGEAVVEIQSDELNKEIADVDLRLKEAELTLETAKEKIEPLRAELNMAQVVEVAKGEKVKVLAQEVNQLHSQNPLPQIRILRQEIEGLIADKNGIEANLKLISEEVEKLAAVTQEGGIAVKELNRSLMEKNNLERLYKEKENQIKVKQQQIAAIALEKQKELDQAISEADQAKAATQKTFEQIQEANAEVKNRQQVVKQLQNELVRVKQKQENLILKTSQAGVVITEKLDKLQNQHLNVGELILEVVDVQQLTAHVKLVQEDKPLVAVGDRVILYPRNPEMEPYHAEVAKIDSVVKTDETGKPFITVQVAVENRGLELKPGETGYAQIQVKKMPIYQKVARELRKLFPRGKW